jgi:hypothetical protein
MVPTPRRRLALPARLARTVAMAICIAWLGYVLASWLVVWNPADAGAYYDAAVRLGGGADLYAPMHPDAHEVYRYAPWFAAAWIPLTWLPRDVALHAWSVAMLACSAAAVWPLVRLGTHASVALGILLGAFLAETSMFGNAHPSVVALLVVAAARPAMPLAVGIAASIKLVPLLFAVVWLDRGAVRPAVVASATAALLWAPILLFDLSGYELSPGTGLLSFYSASPVLWAVLAAASSLVAAWAVIRGSRWAWVAIAIVMFLAPPRVALSYLAFLAPAVLLTLRDRRGD